MKKVYLDFEFNRTTHPNVNLVSCASYVVGEKPKKWWLHGNKKKQQELLNYISNFETIVSYSAVAEARSLFALGFNYKSTLKFNWVDLFLEYRLVTNCNDTLSYGKQLVEGVVKTVQKPKPKWERTEEDKGQGFSPTHSLAEATYKLLGKIRDTEHKTKMRNLIISDPDIFTDQEMEAIMEYGNEDVVDLPLIESEIFKNFCELVGNDKEEISKYEVESFWRGRYSVHTAHMEQVGYPIDHRKTKNFSSQVANILYDCQTQINDFFPSIKPFKWNKKENRMSLNQAAVKNWIIKGPYSGKWRKTEKNQLSLSLDAFQDFYNFAHDYPHDNFGAQMVRYLKLKQSIYGFSTSTTGERKTFWDYVGPDKRVRPYMNHYKAQSSRSQPAAGGFMFLKPAWMRALVQPEKGKAIGGIDWSSQEFLLSALESGDHEMIKAYNSGDVYLAFAKSAGMVPKNATKESHKFERNLAKSTVLGISYMMTKYGLAVKLTEDMGKPFSEEDAEALINAFNEAYPQFYAYQTHEVRSIYETARCIKLNDGWYMWGDNDNYRSTFNVGIQGAGAAIMRKAVDMAASKGITVLFTLHDAIYIEYNVGEEYKMAELNDCMREATVWYYRNEPDPYVKSNASSIRMEPFAWSPDYVEGHKLVRKVGNDLFVHDGVQLVPCSNLYVDDRSIKDYNYFSKNFEDREENEL